MGIFRFFTWFHQNFPQHVTPIKEHALLENVRKGTSIDNFMIDLNGIFHSAAQKVYKYGNFAPVIKRLRPFRNAKVEETPSHEKVFDEVCRSIEELFLVVRPKKRLVMCVDGPAPLSKQNQQRQRRFRGAMTRTEESSLDSDPSVFDSCHITTGTEFMDKLGKHIMKYIKSRMATSILWQNIDVIFSNEKVPGEGENKLICFIRKYGTTEESYCIHGLDADIIMLALGSQMPKFFILRDDLYDDANKYHLVDVGGARKDLLNLMRWKLDDKFDDNLAIYDYIFLCFICGNDFLPHVPSIEIIESGIDVILSIYKKTCAVHGHIVKLNGDAISFHKPSLTAFFTVVGQWERQLIEEKMSKKHQFFPDELLEKHTKFTPHDPFYGCVVDIDTYKEEYYTTKFTISTLAVCHSYIEGMQWVFTYYTQGIPANGWRWAYGHSYAPFASDIAKAIDSYEQPIYPVKGNGPFFQFQQLLAVLPPSSAGLLPDCMGELLFNSELADFCPDEIEIDMSGKKNDYEGVVLLPMVDMSVVKRLYDENIGLVNTEEKDRNKRGLNRMYKYDRVKKTVGVEAIEF